MTHGQAENKIMTVTHGIYFGGKWSKEPCRKVPHGAQMIQQNVFMSSWFLCIRNLCAGWAGDWGDTVVLNFLDLVMQTVTDMWQLWISGWGHKTKVTDLRFTAVKFILTDKTQYGNQRIGFLLNWKYLWENVKTFCPSVQSLSICLQVQYICEKVTLV